MEFSIFTKSSSGVKKEVENYSFDVTYPNDTSNSSNNTNSQVYQVNEVPVTLEQTKSQAISFIRCLVEFSSTLDALPEDRWLTLKLKYFDHTPIDYEPLYFHSNTEKHLFEDNKNSNNGSKESGVVIKVAQLKTSDHHLALTYTGFETLMETPLSSQLQSKCQILRSDANPSNITAIDDKKMNDSNDDTDIIMMSQSQPMTMDSSSITVTTSTSPCTTPHKNKKKNVRTSDSQQSMSMSPSTIATMNTTTSTSMSQKEKGSIIKDPIHQKRKRARTTREKKQQNKQ